MKKTQRKKTDKDHLTVLGLLSSISYWGTTARVLLASVLIWFAYALNLLGSTDVNNAFDAETIYLIFGLTVLVVADLGYMVSARALPLNKNFDRLVMLFGDMLLAGFLIAPSLLILSVQAVHLRIVAVILVLLVISLRILLGLLFGKQRH